jgi:hypothetical protein
MFELRKNCIHIYTKMHLLCYMRTSLHHTLALYFIVHKIYFDLYYCEAKRHVLHSQYKKVEESSTDCDELMHHPLTTTYWVWAENLNLTHVPTPLHFSDPASVETTLFGVACSQQTNNKLECKIILQCW